MNLDPRLQELLDEGVLVVVPRAGFDARPGGGSVVTNMTSMEQPRNTLPMFYLKESTND